MKIITIPDLHGRNIWKSIIYNKYDKMIFVGDYCDSFDKTNIEIYSNLLDLIDFKKKHPEKVVLLLGNHDIQYYYPINFIYKYKCSGYRPEMHIDLYNIFYTNKNLFNITYQIDNYIWSHAGISNEWWKTRALCKNLVKNNRKHESYILKDEFNATDKNIAQYLNTLFEYEHDYLYDVSYHRGGSNKLGGLLWADLYELNTPLKNYHQIVGHTPIKQITTNIINKKTSITFTDILSYYSQYDNKEIKIEDIFKIIEI